MGGGGGCESIGPPRPFVWLTQIACNCCQVQRAPGRQSEHSKWRRGREKGLKTQTAASGPLDGIPRFRPLFSRSVRFAGWAGRAGRRPWQCMDLHGVRQSAGMASEWNSDYSICACVRVLYGKLSEYLRALCVGVCGCTLDIQHDTLHGPSKYALSRQHSHTLATTCDAERGHKS